MKTPNVTSSLEEEETEYVLQVMEEMRNTAFVFHTIL